MTTGEGGIPANPPNREGAEVEDLWAIRPCFLYKEEYQDCKSFKARFHQYFIHGETSDCSQWEKDYEDCLRYENEKDLKAAEAIVKSEEARRKERLKAHYANDVWPKRSAPPPDWNKPLPDWLLKRNENTFLELKAKEIASGVADVNEKSYCAIM